MALSPQWLDELKTRITLSSLIMRTTKLQRAGREWRACCPFHNEKSPSFYVNDEKAFYHCFGCQKHGGAIDWMIEQRGLEFMDAVKELAAEAGLDMPAPDPRAAQQAQVRASLHDVMQAAQDWFAANLDSAEGATARDYLARRGVDAKAMAAFGFGYAPEDRQALTRALARFEPAMLIEAGLLISVDDKQPYARFRERLMLPIRDARGRVIAFGGRILDARANNSGGGVAKYLNSPDTPLFDKGRTLYNMHRASPASRASGRVIVVEGYMDVVALAAAGFPEAVAPMGTALTETQIELLWRMVEKPVLCFDGDSAGKRAAMRAATRALPLLKPGHSLQIVSLPTGLDPDDLIRKAGPGAFEKLLAAPQSLVDLLWTHERDAAPLIGPEDKAGLKARLLAHVDTIAHPDIAALYRRELLDAYGALVFPQRQPQPQDGGQRAWRKGHGARNEPPPRTSPETAARLRKSASGAGRDTLVQAVMAGFARYPGEILRHQDALLELAASHADFAEIVDNLLEYAAALEGDENHPIMDVGILPPPPDKTRFSFLVEGTDPVSAREDLAEAVALLVEKPALEAAIVAANARFDSDPEGAFAEQQLLRKRKLEIDERIGQMARKRAASAAPEEIEQSEASPATDLQETD